MTACSRGPFPTLRDFAGNMTEQTSLLESRQTSPEDPTFGSPVDLSFGRRVLAVGWFRSSPAATPGQSYLRKARAWPHLGGRFGVLPAHPRSLCCAVVPQTTGYAECEPFTPTSRPRLSVPAGNPYRRRPMSGPESAWGAPAAHTHKADLPPPTECPKRWQAPPIGGMGARYYDALSCPTGPATP